MQLNIVWHRRDFQIHSSTSDHTVKSTLPPLTKPLPGHIHERVAKGLHVTNVEGKTKSVMHVKSPKGGKLTGEKTLKDYETCELNLCVKPDHTLIPCYPIM